MPFTVAEHEGVLTLTLDTPGSAVNIFNRATAEQLHDILASVTPATTRAIVFATAKEHSFINGVGLLLAHATQTFEDVVHASTPAWTAYRAVRESPVPTIAVVQGSCFGCGVEFALQCDYRIATDSCQTQFYMTELNDYLFIPLFGGTWNLPAAVGLADAVDLLLWGERWNGEQAHARGLIDEVVPHEHVAEGTQAFVDRVLAGTQTSRRRGPVVWGAGEERAGERARRRIQSLPPPYHEVYDDALSLLEAGARQSTTHADHQRAELRCAATSALSPIGKGAYAFFYLRQIAAERAAGRGSGARPPATLSLDVDPEDDARAFAEDLERRKFPLARPAEHDGAEFRLVGSHVPSNGIPRANRNGDARLVAVRLSIAAVPSTGAALYVPAYRCGGRLIELAIPSGSELEEAASARLTRTLQGYGFEVARTTPADTFVSNRLLVAYLGPLLRYIGRGGEVTAVNGTLRQHGFVRRPHDLLAALDRPGITRLVTAELDLPPSDIARLLAALECGDYNDASDPVVMDALSLSLLGAVVEARRRDEVGHPTVTDLIARELLDFPRHLCSLSTWLKIARVAPALQSPQARSLVGEAALASASGFVAAGREFYR